MLCAIYCKCSVNVCYISDDVDYVNGSFSSSIGDLVIPDDGYTLPVVTPSNKSSSIGERMKKDMFSDNYGNKKYSIVNVPLKRAMSNSDVASMRTDRGRFNRPVQIEDKIDLNTSVCCVVACCESQANVYVEDEHYTVNKDVVSGARGFKKRF